MVDTLGLLVAVVVHSAGEQDRDGVKALIEEVRHRLPRLKIVWADGGYAGELVDWVRRFAGWTLEIVRRSDALRGFVLLPKRWIVERTFGWLGRYRRHSKDYELLPQSSENMIYISMINLMLHRLSPETRRRHRAF